MIFPWEQAVSNEDAMRFSCPFCDAARGVMCTRTTQYAKDELGRPIEWGSPLQVAHWQRKDLVRNARQRAYYQRMRKDLRPVHPVSRGVRQVRAALLAWDLREYTQLRDWLREHGHILWEKA